MISVIIPTRERPLLLERCLGTLIVQKNPELEFLVLDDSRDESVLEKNQRLQKIDSRIKHICVRDMIKVRKRGIGELLNLGAKLSNAEIIARIDDDDLSLPGRFNFQHRELIHKSLDLHATRAINVDYRLHYLSTTYTPRGQCQLVKFFEFENPIVHSSVMFKKESFLKVGGYNEDFSSSQDYDLWSKMLQHGFRCEISSRKFVVAMRWSQSLTSTIAAEERESNILKINQGIQSVKSDYQWLYKLRTLKLLRLGDLAIALKLFSKINLNRLFLILDAISNELMGRMKYYRYYRFIRKSSISEFLRI